MTIFRMTSIARSENEVNNTTYATEGAILNNKALNKTWQLYAATDGKCGEYMYCEGNIADVLEYVKAGGGDWWLKPVTKEPQGVMTAMFAHIGSINYIIRKIDVDE